MKTNIKNFLRIIRRFKMAVALNILGLSVAFAAFMVIMMQLHYDFSFGKCHKDYDKIFRVERTIDSSSPFMVISRPFAERLFESSPQIIAGAIVNPWTPTAAFHVEKEGGRNFYEENALTVSPSFFDVFTFDFVEGSKNNNIAPGSIFIPLSMARKLFGKEPAVGQQIVHSSWGNQTVMAVYRDFPTNSIVQNCIYFAMNATADINSWNNNSYYVYIRVNQASDVSLLFDNLKRNFDGKEAWGNEYNWDESGVGLRFTPLSDIHFVTGVEFDEMPKASKQTLMILFAIAIVIIVIAGINFTNFSTALAPMRVKKINTQRVLGAPLNSLRLSLVSEVIIISVFSYLVSILFVLLFGRTPLASLVDADLSLSVNPLVVFGTALIALLTGLFAGLYPAFYMTSFAPAMVINSSFGRSPKGKKIRNTLIGVQYVASFALIIGASFMYLQNHFMQHSQSSLGYDKDELLTVNVGKIASSRDAFTNQLMAYPGIEDVTYGERLLSSSDRYENWNRTYKGEVMNYNIFSVHYSFLKVMGIEITEGRDFRAEDANVQYGVYVFNETARNKYNLEVGTTIEGFGEGISGGEIIGFISDLKFTSFRKAVEPMAFYVWGTENWSRQPNEAYIKVKAGADKRAAMMYIHSTLAEFGPNYTFNVRFYDDVVQKLYEKEIAVSLLITLFSLIAIFISIVGVFGLVIFDSECRRKEIGIRKVLGASTIGIIVMFNKGYFKILVICFVMASPLAWYAVNRWLENFAYKTPMYWWVYLLAFVAVGIITAATVTFQNWRVANDDPVKAIKSE